MQSGLTCRRYLNDIRGIINSISSPTAYISVPQRGWSSGFRNHHAQLQRRLRPRFGLPQIRNSASAGAQGKRENERSHEPNLTPALDLRHILTPDNLFHPYSESPSPDLRRRAAVTMSQAFCPHPDHHLVHLPTTAFLEDRKSNTTTPKLPPAHVGFECPDCGIPVYCTQEHWEEDYENHMKICDVLRQINEDDHDLRSGRHFQEFLFPELQLDISVVNMANWDLYLYTRDHDAINSERSLRQVTRMLTYPVTIGSVLHEHSPYTMKRGGRLTMEGMKSLTGK